MSEQRRVLVTVMTYDMYSGEGYTQPVEVNGINAQRDLKNAPPDTYTIRYTQFYRHFNADGVETGMGPIRFRMAYFLVKRGDQEARVYSLDELEARGGKYAEVAKRFRKDGNITHVFPLQNGRWAFVNPEDQLLDI